MDSAKFQSAAERVGSQSSRPTPTSVCEHCMRPAHRKGIMFWLHLLYHPLMYLCIVYLIGILYAFVLVQGLGAWSHKETTMLGAALLLVYQYCVIFSLTRNGRCAEDSGPLFVIWLFRGGAPDWNHEWAQPRPKAAPKT